MSVSNIISLIESGYVVTGLLWNDKSQKSSPLTSCLYN